MHISSSLSRFKQAQTAASPIKIGHLLAKECSVPELQYRIVHCAVGIFTKYQKSWLEQNSQSNFADTKKIEFGALSNFAFKEKVKNLIKVLNVITSIHRFSG